MTSRDTLAKLAKQREGIKELESDVERLSEWIEDSRFMGSPPDLKLELTDDYRLEQWGPPQYETDGAAAIDLRCVDQVRRPHVTESFMVGTGVKADIPDGYAGIVVIRSSIAHWLTLSNSIGVIDSDYRGEIKLSLDCHLKDGPLEPGMRLAQMMVVPCPQANIQIVDQLDDTDRGEGGFGSTGER
jgi:dUTP pyrophosphatase